MAKNQQLPLAPTEISGVCGRLLCCLAYEDSMYTELRKSLPKVGSKIQVEEGEGVIRGLNILKQTIIVELPETRTRVEMPLPGQEGAQETSPKTGSQHLLSKQPDPGQDQTRGDPRTEAKQPQANRHLPLNPPHSKQVPNHLKNQKSAGGPAHALKEEKTNLRKLRLVLIHP